MKKLIIIFIALILIHSTLAITIEENQKETVEGREITLVSVQESKAVISVDGEKGILSLNERKIINGIEITLTDIFYSEDLALVSIDTKLTYSCGDGICSASESSENCCSDCGCTGSQECVENSCIIPECMLDEDCNDSNPLTQDSCSNYSCKFKEIKCSSNSECDDGDIDTEDSCYKGQCQNLPPICRTDKDCDDLNPCTLDQCINKDCQFKDIPNCNKEEKTETKTEEIIEFSQDSNNNFIQRFFSWIKNLF